MKPPRFARNRIQESPYFWNAFSKILMDSSNFAQDLVEKPCHFPQRKQIACRLDDRGRVVATRFKARKEYDRRNTQNHIRRWPHL